MVCIGGALVAAAWVINAFANSLALLYVAAFVAGLGAGPIFSATNGNALRWFPDRAGLATGLSAAGFGAGAVLTVVPLAGVIETRGYETAFMWFGIGQGLVVMAVALMLRGPRPSEVVLPQAPRVLQSSRDHAPAEVLRSVPFWLLYAMFVMVGTGGLMVTAQLAPVARDFGIDHVPVSLLGLTMPALGFALAVGLVLNGVSRPFWGWVSDHIGREKTMLVVFVLEGIAIGALYLFGHNPVLFVLLAGLVYFAWGEIFALFPAICTDIYGRRFAATNYSMLYTAKGTAALLVPFGNVLATATGSWTAVFVVASALNILAGLIAFVVLKPLRMRAAVKEDAAAPAPSR
jgi:OFA family oxalate/formate antiporter-like MFS transporter